MSQPHKTSRKIIIALILAAVLLAAVITIFAAISVRREDSQPTDSQPGDSQSMDFLSGDSQPMDSQPGDSQPPAASLRDVLLGDASFSLISDGKEKAVMISEVPALFDAGDPYMAIWDFSLADLDKDGENEVVLSVIGAAGDAGGRLILHESAGEIFGYRTDSRTLTDLKTDGTYSYSDPTGVQEAGVAAITGFSETGFTSDRITYATGTYEGFTDFTVEQQPATEEDYTAALALQAQKPGAEQYEFTAESINAAFPADN